MLVCQYGYCWDPWSTWRPEHWQGPHISTCYHISMDHHHYIEPDWMRGRSVMSPCYWEVASYTGVSLPPLFLLLRPNLKDQDGGGEKMWPRIIPYSSILNSRVWWGRKNIKADHAFLFTVDHLSHWSSLWYKKWLAVELDMRLKY